MKRIFSIFMIVVLAISLCSCSKQDLADMTTSVTDDYAAIVWGDKTYVPYDAAMLHREIDVTDIPNGWQSEYEWNQ